jgi:hypothetical protein
LADARPLLAQAADARPQQAQIYAAQDISAPVPADVPVTPDSWTRAASDYLAVAPRPPYVCADCWQLFAHPDHDEGDGEDYCPNPDCGERLVPDENWLDAEEVDSLPAKLRLGLLESLVCTLRTRGPRFEASNATN